MGCTTSSAAGQREATQVLADFLVRHSKIIVLTGAGCSTASGIPEYRDDNGRWKHEEPMRYAQFVGNQRNRQRYWAQSFGAWEQFSSAEPNEAHYALSALERHGHFSCLVTQNVDGLHQKAGSREVTDLHGALHRVRCIGCARIVPRDDFQQQLRRANPTWRAVIQRRAPDGDASLSRSDFESFVVPDCPNCDGVLKPDVVFFGESVPRERVDAVYRYVLSCDALLVVGSSLMVYSGYRFALAAHRAGKSIAIVNRGRTRADGLVDHKLTGNCTDILPRTLELLL